MKALMLGNGLNRCLQSEIAWEDLLEDIRNEYNINDAVSKNISFPMQFECIVNYIQMNNDYSVDLYTELKEKISKKIKGINGFDYKDGLHAIFLKLGYQTILTTNYDYILEEFFIKYLHEELTEKDDSETKYSLSRWRQFSSCRIYHIHGEANIPSSLCLGYEHYAGTIEKMRREISRETIKSGGTPRILELMQNEKIYKKEQNNWVLHFFTDDVDIVGLGLPESEIDLWWLITYRASLKYSHPLGRKLIENKITYHTAIEPGSKKKTSLKKNLFENMGIDYIEYDLIDNNYMDLYFEIAKNISSNK